jgi:hypothetical protein
MAKTRTLCEYSTEFRISIDRHPNISAYRQRKLVTILVVEDSVRQGNEHGGRRQD